jgi:hypothetical protein
VDGKPMIGLIGRAVAMVQTVGTSAAVVVDMMAVGVRQDLGEVEWPSPQGRTVSSNSSSRKFCLPSPSHLYISFFLSFFLSFFDARFAKKTNGESAASQLEGCGLKNG